MKSIIKIIFITGLIISCSKERSEIVGITLEDYQYKITSFTSQNSIDINNDGIANTDMLLELSDYFLPSYDLRILVKRELVLYDFFLPFQNIDYSDYVQFTKFGYSIITEEKFDLIENYDLNNETKVISFEKISELEYKLTLEKKYFDFNLNQDVNCRFNITYELNN